MSCITRASRLKRASAAVAVSFAAFLSSACSGTIDGDAPQGQAGVGGTGSATGGKGATTSGGTGPNTGGSSTAGGSTGGSSTAGGAAGTAGGSSGGGSTGGSGGTEPLSTGGVLPRLLTQSEYLASVQSLFGTVNAALDLPLDTSVGAFVSLGASKVTVNATAADKYEVASRAIAAEVFGDTARWQALVGCQPQADLSDACVETFTRAFGRKAFRRDLSDAEFQQWVKIARDAAAATGTAAYGLQTLTSGFLQSPNFLYRVETNALDATNGRLKYDGRSMAIRLAFFLTGGPPNEELLAAGESGQLDTAAGVQTAAASMLSNPAFVTRLTSFFYEYSQAELVTVSDKDPTMFPTFNDSLKNSMKEGTRLFLEKVVLAPGADVRSLFDSNQTFADAALAPIYGLTAPNSGFAQFTLPPTSGRVGLMGQAAMLAAHSKSDHSSPTVRGLYMVQAFFCTVPDPPPGNVNTELKEDPTLTTRQRLEQHRADPRCAGCHGLFDPMGMALEHFDSIGRYREMENGLEIDASGILEEGTTFEDAVGLGAALRASPYANECLLRNFYRNANGRADDLFDQPQVDAMGAALAARNHVFRDFVADFVVSDAFRSAPALPINSENQ
jgi:hypothetical protein